MIKYIVKLNYDGYEFSDRLAALAFADAAKEHQAESKHVVIELVKEEEA